MTGHPLVLATGKVIGRTVGPVAMLPIESRHYLAAGQGYSIDAGVLRAIEVRGCELIEFHHKKTGRVFRIPLATFKEQAKAFDYGYGPKLVAPESLYEIIPPEGAA